MKNLYLLPTDKPSRLFRSELTNNLGLDKKYTIRGGRLNNQHIYIISDEEIKEGDWHLHYYEGKPVISKSHNSAVKVINEIAEQFGYKKIILTTDQDLIKGGVQDIDDEFLEWFVKNPTCEFVEIDEKSSDEIEKELGIYGHDIGLTESEYNEWLTNGGQLYKIIIPKEEPKTMFESLQEYLKNTPKEKVIEDWNEFQQLDEEGITVKEFLGNQKQETFVNEKCFKCGRNQYSSRKPFCTDDFCNKDFYQKPKQETLEEVAKKYSENWEEITGLDYENTVSSEVNKLDFINGAKWQQEQNKNLYTEEDLREAFIAGGNSQIEEDDEYGTEYNAYMEGWFEQFKKK